MLMLLGLLILANQLQVHTDMRICKSSKRSHFFSLDRPEITTAAAAATAKKSNGKINAMIFVGPFRWDLSPYYIYVTIILIIIIVI